MKKVILLIAFSLLIYSIMLNVIAGKENTEVGRKTGERGEALLHPSDQSALKFLP